MQSLGMRKTQCGDPLQQSLGFDALGHQLVACVLDQARQIFDEDCLATRHLKTAHHGNIELHPIGVRQSNTPARQASSDSRLRVMVYPRCL